MVLQQISLAVLIALSSVTVVAATPQTGSEVYWRIGAEARLDGSAVDIQRVPFPAIVGDVRGDWLWLDLAWVHKDDVLLPDDALSYYTNLIQQSPTVARNWNRRGTIHASRGEYEIAIEDLTQAIQLDPNSASACVNRGIAWSMLYDFKQALEDFTKAMKLAPTDPSAFNAAAWLRATCPDADYRDGKKAIAHAMKACELSAWKESKIIDTLAAAYAQAGDYRAAIQWQRRAIDLAAKGPNQPAMRIRLASYGEGRPYRELRESYEQKVGSVRPIRSSDEETKIAAILAGLPDQERRLVETQRFCPVMEQNRLGSMGIPVKVTIDGKTVYLCCDGCKKKALAAPKQTLAKVVSLIDDSLAHEAEIKSELAKLTPRDREIAEAQRFCVLLPKNRLGSMGTPVRLVVGGKTLFVCCEGCAAKALADPQKTLSMLDELQRRNGREQSDDAHDLFRGQEELTQSDEDEIAAALGELPEGDRALVVAQKFCAVHGENRLGSMGPPIKVMIEGQPVFLCCGGCKAKALAEPEATLANAAKLMRTAEKR